MSAVLYVTVVTVVLGAAVALAIHRIIKGPGAVDRAIANEVLVATTVCALGVEAALNRHSTTLPVLLSLSLVGFLASVAVARFVARDRDGIRTQLGDDRPSPEEPR